MPKRILQGVVVSDKQDKTVIVSVERQVMHPVYKKFVKKSKRFAAHDENNQFKVGDVVSIQESRPYSKTKTWTVMLQIIQEHVRCSALKFLAGPRECMQRSVMS